MLFDESLKRLLDQAMFLPSIDVIYCAECACHYVNYCKAGHDEPKRDPSAAEKFVDLPNDGG
jgi:hypothetical protein